MDEFVKAATSGRRARAAALYDQADDPWAKLVKGEGWEGDASAPGGPNGWAPLLYVTHSVYASVDLARDLLARGADPNVTFSSEYGEMSALYGAAGVVHDPRLTRVLLEAGANPDDGESVYHATEAADPACLRALVEHGATVEPIHVAHALDDERLEHVKLLLETGVDARELLPHAVRRGRGPEYIQLLCDHGAALEHRAGEGWRKPTRLRTAYQHAQLRNADEVAQLLVELGAETEVDADDLNVAAIARGEDDRGPEDPDYDQQEVLILAALRGQATRVIEAYGPDFEGVVGGSPKAPLLHHAAWFGAPAVVDALLAAGADPLAGEWSPLATAVHASGDPHRDHVGVAERLVAAGCKIEPWMLEQADGPLSAWLRGHQRGDG
jgi:hypothetical protein